MNRSGFSYDAMIHSADDANGNTLSDATGQILCLGLRESD